MSLLYEQVADALRQRVAKGVWKTGDRLPSERELCVEFEVSTITVRHAVAQVVAEGLLVRLQGRGTFVASDHVVVQGPPALTSFTQDLNQRGWQSSAKVLQFETVSPPEPIRIKLRLAAFGLVYVLRRLRLADGLPIAIQSAYLPAAWFLGLAQYDFTAQSLYGVLEGDYHVRLGQATETYRPGVVTEEEAKLLATPVGAPAFRIERVTSDVSGRPIELVESVTHGERWALTVHLTRSALRRG